MINLVTHYKDKQQGAILRIVSSNSVTEHNVLDTGNASINLYCKKLHSLHYKLIIK